jgi:DNA repair photolyase
MNLLFDLGRKPPTTKMIALQVREHGAGSLDQAQRRADEARYQEVTCRSALNPVKGMPFNWTLNPYRGCTHACHYCFARRYQTQFELGPDDEFSSLIFVKVNFPDVLRRELDKPSWTRETVALGTATDPYQPIEGQYKLTRGTIVELGASKTPFGIITKGPMVMRDADVLQQASRAARVTVCVSVPTVDEDAWRKLEPGTAHPRQRLRAVRALRRAGIRAGVLMAPLVPGITTSRKLVESTLAAIAEHDAAFVGANVLHLEGGTRDHFMKYLAKDFPSLVPGYERLFPHGAKRVPKTYSAAVHATVRELREALGLSEKRFE